MEAVQRTLARTALGVVSSEADRQAIAAADQEQGFLKAR